MGIPKIWRCNTESHTENFGLVRDYIPKISGILVWDRDFFGLVWDFWDFFPALAGGAHIIFWAKSRGNLAFVWLLAFSPHI